MNSNNFSLFVMCAALILVSDISGADRFTRELRQLSENVYVKAKHEDISLNLRAFDVTTHSMTLSWSPPSHLNFSGYKISFDANKEYVDSQGLMQTITFKKTEIFLNRDETLYTINELSPYTTYEVNISTVSEGNSSSCSDKIFVTTIMAAPNPMIKPDVYNVVDNKEILIILPQASEEYGPISHYYVIVVPEDNMTAYDNPDELLTDTIIAYQKENPNNITAPYIAAKLLRKTPYIFALGDGEMYEGFKNCILEPGKKYRIFVRAVVDWYKQDLYTSSPFCEVFLDMPSFPSRDPPVQPNPNVFADKCCES